VIVVDSGVWIDYFNGIDSVHTDRLDGLLGVEPVAVGDLILTEVLQGFRSDIHYKKAKELMTSLTLLEMLGQKMAIQSADNYRFLRAKGITIRKTADIIIATCCIEHRLPLLFVDSDFAHCVRHLGLKDGLAGA
jgi:predicted nucleic acid-binding protein